MAELIPIQPPSIAPLPVEAESAFLTALENRAEIDAATQEIEAARVRLNVAKNELLPVLDLYLESYVSGLRDNFNVGRSLVDQFSVGEPSYAGGLRFEMPYERRAAKANQERRLAELRQLTSKFQATVETLHAEVDVAVREVDTTHRELRSLYTQMLAAKTDMDYLQGRWERLPGDDRAASFLLEDLLASQERLSFAESAFVDAQVAYALSLNRLNRSTGMLLKHEKVQLVRGHDGSASTLSFEPLEAAGPSNRGSLPAPGPGSNAPPPPPGTQPRIAPPANRIGPTAKQPQRNAVPPRTSASVGGSPWNNRLANSPPVTPGSYGSAQHNPGQTTAGYGASDGRSGRPVPAGYVPPSAYAAPTGYAPQSGYAPPGSPATRGIGGGGAYPASAYPQTSQRGPTSGEGLSAQGYNEQASASGNAAILSSPFGTRN